MKDKELTKVSTKITLVDIERRLEIARPRRISLQEVYASDKKTYRLDLPRSYQPAFQGLSGGCRYAVESDDHLVLVPIEVWPAYLSTLPQSFAVSDFEFLRKEAIRNSWPAQIASRGRVQIPREAADIIGLKNQAQLFAVGGVIEIWDPETYLRRRREAYAELRQSRLCVPEAKENFPKFPTQEQPN